MIYYVKSLKTRDNLGFFECFYVFEFYVVFMIKLPPLDCVFDG